MQNLDLKELVFPEKRPSSYQQSLYLCYFAFRQKWMYSVLVPPWWISNYGHIHAKFRRNIFLWFYFPLCLSLPWGPFPWSLLHGGDGISEIANKCFLAKCDHGLVGLFDKWIIFWVILLRIWIIAQYFFMTCKVILLMCIPVWVSGVKELSIKKPYR